MTITYRGTAYLVRTESDLIAVLRWLAFVDARETARRFAAAIFRPFGGAR